jgi:hypothetical protein
MFTAHYIFPLSMSLIRFTNITIRDTIKYSMTECDKITVKLSHVKWKSLERWFTSDLSGDTIIKYVTALQWKRDFIIAGHSFSNIKILSLISKENVRKYRLLDTMIADINTIRPTSF